MLRSECAPQVQTLNPNVQGHGTRRRGLWEAMSHMGGAPGSGICALYKTDPREPLPLLPREDAVQGSVYTLGEDLSRLPLPPCWRPDLRPPALGPARKLTPVVQESPRLPCVVTAARIFLEKSHSSRNARRGFACVSLLCPGGSPGGCVGDVWLLRRG